MVTYQIWRSEKLKQLQTFVEYYNFEVAINLQVKKKCDNTFGHRVFTQNYI